MKDQLCTQTRLDIRERESEKDLLSGYVTPPRAEHRGSDENEVTEVSAAGIWNQRKKKKVQSGSSAVNNWMPGR